MSLDDLANRSISRGWQECGVHYALRVLPDDRAAVLLAALGNTNVAHAEIADALAEELDDGPAAFAVGRHRIGKCKCTRA